MTTMLHEPESQKRAERRGSPIGFRWERDMVPWLEGAADQFLPLSEGGEVRVLCEVPTASGIPDVLIARLDDNELRRRDAADLGPVEEVLGVRVLIAVAGGDLSIDRLAAVVHVSASHLRRSVLPSLAERGWTDPVIARGGNATVTARYHLRDVACDLVTIEAKKSAWRHAAQQAVRHIPSADASYIAIDSAHARIARERRHDLGKAGIGVAVVDAPSGRVSLVQRPRRTGTNPAMRAVVAERAWSMVRDGRTVGAQFPVFGRDLSAAV